MTKKGHKKFWRTKWSWGWKAIPKM